MRQFPFFSLHDWDGPGVFSILGTPSLSERTQAGGTMNDAVTFPLFSGALVAGLKVPFLEPRTKIFLFVIFWDKGRVWLSFLRRTVLYSANSLATFLWTALVAFFSTDPSHFSSRTPIFISYSRYLFAASSICSWPTFVMFAWVNHCWSRSYSPKRYIISW